MTPYSQLLLFRFFTKKAKKLSGSYQWATGTGRTLGGLIPELGTLRSRDRHIAQGHPVIQK